MNTMNGTIVNLQICPAHRAPMLKLDSVKVIDDWGLEGDRHAHTGGTRQVLLMDEETLKTFDLAAGMVRENITTRGIALQELIPGTRLRVGTAVLEITKVCTPCSRMDEIRAGLKTALEGQRGLLARVIQGGLLNVGDPVTLE